MSAIIRVINYSLTLKSHLKETSILNDINLEIHKGEIIGLIGMSGSGKTMLALSISDLLYSVDSKTSGRIEYFNASQFMNILELSAKQLTEYRRSFVSFIYQDSLSALNPTKTCGWQIDEALRLSHSELNAKERRSVVTQTLLDVDLADADRIYKSYPHQLSGGQLQRVLIAMSIIQRPQLIIADEPTSSLDQETEKVVLDLILTLQEEYGFALVLISHDLNLVRSFCDRIVLMDKGELSSIGDNQSIIMFDDTSENKKYTHLEEESSEQAYFQMDKLSHSYSRRNSLFGKTTNIPSLTDISFTVRKSEILGIMGPSGSGKSTIAKLLTGFESPSSGNVYFQSFDLTKAFQNESQDIRRKIQIIFQNPFSSLNPKQRVGDCIKEVFEVKMAVKKSESTEATLRILELVGLSGTHLNRLPRQLSGGEQQRVSIARALALQPEVLICDECVSALDVNTKYEFLNLLLKLRLERQLTIIFISHDINAVEYVSDRVLQIENGRIT